MANDIHPTAILNGGVHLGNGNVVLPYTVLTGPLDIGDNNLIGPLTVIGSPGAHTRDPRYDSSQSAMTIGSNNIIREHVAIQKPYYRDATRVGNGTYIMQNAHVSHDAVLEDDVVLAPGVGLAGSVCVLRGANVAIGCTVHQHCVIGQYSIAAMGAAVTKNIRPFSRHIPGRPLSVNRYAIEKHGFSGKETEIERYVLHGQQPKSPDLISIIEHYMTVHQASGRQEY